MKSLTRDSNVAVSRDASLPRQTALEVSLLTGCQDRSYACGLAMALISNGVPLDFIGSDDMDSSQLHSTPGLNFLNLRGDQRQDASLSEKILRILIYYGRLIRYAWKARPGIFHVLWNNKFELFDRTLLMLYYKLRGKKIAFTAHNVNTRKRDSTDSLLNRLTLRIQYRLCNHIFVHTEKMKTELFEDFGVSEKRVTVIPFGINNFVPDTELKPADAKRQLGIGDGERTILFFGRIGPYKGLQFLVDAFQRIAVGNSGYRLIIVGRPKVGCEKYLDEIRQTINRDGIRERVIQKIEFVPDADTELYFKAADVLVLPYTDICQSGVLFLAYNFGLPVIASDVGLFRDDIIEGMTGYLCKPCDPVDLAKTIERYFDSGLFKDLDGGRREIRDYAYKEHSWDLVGKKTRQVYSLLLRRTDYGTSDIDSHSCAQRAGVDC